MDGACDRSLFSSIFHISARPFFIDTPLFYHPLRIWSEAAALWVGFCAALFFYGVGVNLSFLWVALVAPGLVLVCAAGERWRWLLRQRRNFVWISLFSLLYLFAHHWLVSISRDSSFGAGLVISALPVWMMAVLLCARPKLVFNGIAWLVFACVSVAFVQYLVSGQRPYAPLMDPNNFTALVLLAWVPWMHARLREPGTRIQSALSQLVCALLVVVVLAGESRFGMLMLGAVLVYWGWITWRYRWSWGGLASIWVAALVGLLLYQATASGGEAATAAPVANSAEDYRRLLYGATWRGVLEYGGVLGAGLGSFVLLYPQLRAVEEQNTAGLYAHNDYLQLLLEAGIPALLVLLALVCWVAVRLLRATFWRLPDRWVHGPLIALGMALLHAAVNFVFFILVLGVMVGVLLAVSLRASETADTPQAERDEDAASLTMGALRGVRVLCASTLLVIAAYLALDVYIYGVLSGQKAVPAVTALRQDSLGFARAAADLNADRGVPVLAQAELLRLRGTHQDDASEIEKLDALYRAAIRLDPWNPLTYTAYFGFLRGSGQQDHFVLEGLLDKALELNPADFATSLLAVEFLQDVGRSERADAVLIQALRWCGVLRKGNAAGLAQLARTAQRRLSDAPGDAVTNALEGCRRTQAAIIPTHRAPPLLLKWLRSANS
ncbi:MAG: O-antigen ligase family protein [Pseudomonadota bacterium]